MTTFILADSIAGNTYDTLYFTGLFLTGLIFGFTVCSFSCLPVVCTYVLGTQKDFKSGLKTALTFSAGRVGGYVLAGMLCGLTGMAAEKFFQGKQTMIAAGILFLLTGLSVAFSTGKKNCSKQRSIFIKKSENRKLHMGLLGGITGMMPCVPYTAVMAGAAASGSVVKGGLSALAFGLGTSVSPILLLGGGAGWFAGRIREKIPGETGLLRFINGGVLAFIGIRMLVA